jgi:hypothetical protein
MDMIPLESSTVEVELSNVQLWGLSSLGAAAIGDRLDDVSIFGFCRAAKNQLFLQSFYMD